MRFEVVEFRYIPKMKENKKLEGKKNGVKGSIIQRDMGGLIDHLIGALIQPLAKAMAKITKGVDIPNMII